MSRLIVPGAEEAASFRQPIGVPTPGLQVPTIGCPRCQVLESQLEAAFALLAKADDVIQAYKTQDVNRAERRAHARKERGSGRMKIRR